MRTPTRVLFAVVAVSVAFVVTGCGSSGGSEAAPDTTTATTAATGDTTDTTAASSSGGIGIGIANVALDGNDNRIEFTQDDGDCAIDEAAGTAKVSVAKDGATFDLDYDQADAAAATAKFTDANLNVNAGAGASTPEFTDVVVADGEFTANATFDSPDEGADKTYLGEIKVTCP